MSCKIFLYFAICYNALQYLAMSCHVLQYLIVCLAMSCKILQFFAICTIFMSCNVLQYLASLKNFVKLAFLANIGNLKKTYLRFAPPYSEILFIPYRAKLSACTHVLA